MCLSIIKNINKKIDRRTKLLSIKIYLYRKFLYFQAKPCH